MPSFELNRLQSITGVAPTSGSDRAKTKAPTDGGAPSSGEAQASAANASGVAVEIAAPAQNGPPVDNERVAQIRDALREGTYPLVPAKIADAMIAAQLKFELGQ